MFIQYKRNRTNANGTADVDLKNLGLDENGLIICGIKTTAGAPASTAGIFNPAAMILNTSDKKTYSNAGTTASPSWTFFDTAAGLTLTNGHLFVGSAGNLPVDVALSGDASIINTGLLTVTGWQGNPVSANAPAPGDVMSWNGAVWLPGAVVASALTSAHIFVGNVGNVAVDVAMSGDISINNLGITTYLGQKVFVAQKLLSNADVLALNGTPIQIVAATGVATEIIMPIVATMAYTRAVASYATNTEIDLIHDTSSQSLMDSDIGAGASTFAPFENTSYPTPSGNVFIANKDLNIFAPVGNPTGGNAGSSILVTVLYTIMSVI
jgi:hypothetical protein